GIAPVRLLLLRTKSETWFNLPNDDGIFPVKKLKLKSTSFRRLRCPNSPGKSPWNPLPLKLREAKNERFPNSGGIVPVRFMLGRFKATILLCLAPQVTPIQLQKEWLVVQLSIRMP
ncbi:hypothetical protein V6Z11_A05G316300, partial [Gossypium hirsutum]